MQAWLPRLQCNPHSLNIGLRLVAFIAHYFRDAKNQIGCKVSPTLCLVGRVNYQQLVLSAARNCGGM